MKIAIVTDAWFPQTNGVVKTLSTTAEQLRGFGHDVCVIEPGQFRTFPCPTYPEIRLAWFPYRLIDRLLREFAPDAVHIATEGTLGAAARRWCRKQHMPFTTSYHTQFPEYIRARAPIPLAISYAHLRGFHGGARRTMVATPALQRQLEARGFRNLVRWTRGVDVDLFRPRPKEYLSLPRPIAVYVGRVAVEKNIEAFLRMEWKGSKLIVGDGPARKTLQEKYPNATFVGFKYGEELASHVAASDVFVFPSRTDTFGLVLLEAMACGVPVAAYPVTGPIDVVLQGETGVLDDDLAIAAVEALTLDPQECRDYALAHTWEAATQQFLTNLAPRPALESVVAATKPLSQNAQPAQR
ncbi:glycosyltransferase involved in cell wall biosynthesis [Povalibacter uvarum]|uniref:Glycosyltransferase involved in cell wall biosynthesis n=1 Tax=Povalibacter uvarum TaxID=732238 RepID=A0A841HKI4_9GAMM|nr:glycosyltransferase family 1 protein [Povalibacter uvarum]MBB6093084.1 glycosyltransferase involved in cell wall biosynthesis [Povalibacter uvarum]